MKRKQKQQQRPTPELPEARPLPGEANPGGTEGADSGWSGGASNIGEVLHPEPPDADTTFTGEPRTGREHNPRSLDM